MSGSGTGAWPARDAPALAFLGETFEPAHVEISGDGRLLVERTKARPVVVAPGAGALLLPGFVNAHSHAFQRVLRGRVEDRRGDFWSWRERMYHAALELDPDDVRAAARAAFLEMLLSGITSVVEFHYLHHGPLGRPYADPNELAFAVLEAAAEVGIRIRLLLTAYARAGVGFVPDPAQKRFIDTSLEAFLRRAEALQRAIEDGSRPRAGFGVALHSVRALPRDWLVELAGWAESRGLPVHMHVAEQPAEIESCLGEHGRRPVELLEDLGVLGHRFTAVHAIHVTEPEIALLARSGAGVCACPSTEANLGDGFLPAARLYEAGVPVCLGTDSHASIDLFAEMRELDYRERLRSGTRRGAASPGALLRSAASVGAERAGWSGLDGGAGRGMLLDPRDVPAEDSPAGDASVEGQPDLPDAASGAPGHPAGGCATGRIETGFAADLVVLDEAEPCLAGAARGSLPATLVVAGSARLVREVYVAGRRVVEGGRHALQEEIAREFAALQRRLWRGD